MLLTGCIIKNNRGSVFMLTMMVVLLLTIMAVSVLVLTGNALYLGRIRRAQAEAFNIAESGAEMGALWMRAQAFPPSYLTSFDPFGGSQALGDGSYQVTIYPDPDNGTSYLKTYRVVSVGTVGATSKTVEIVLRQATFGRFAYFTDKETSSISGGAIWWKAGEICDGPAHSNNTDGSSFQINYSGSTEPIFLDLLTASGSSINYSPSRPEDEPTFRKIYADGSKGFKLGMPRIELPDSSDIQKNAAWGSSTGFPMDEGVYLQSSLDGGIYIHGDCSMQFSVIDTTTQEIVIHQGTDTTTIEVDLAARTSSMTKPDSTIVPGGMLNGVIYCTGNITSLEGEIADNRVISEEIDIRSSWTIATDVNNGKDITITDDLVYHTKPDKEKSSDDPVNLAAGTLGLVAENIVISSSAPSSLEIDAVCMAGGRNTSAGSFYVSNYGSKTPVGTLTVYGGIIQKARGPVGTFNPSTGQTVTGYAKNYRYDPRLSVNPPPFYPTTGTYERLSWRVVAN